ncbi:uncharacterized protein LOC135809421 isoform X2 [Sycon ciliatum]|uniref:uncharacterized protein LOC135809421 isoform X2 n=1 Tax=Sycon ciliatum TaxID=27933 RepID=UPI0031F64CD2
MRSYDLFELVRLLDVHPSSQYRTGLSESSSSSKRRGAPICDAVWCESSNAAHQLLVLRCSDGNLLLRFDPSSGVMEGDCQESVKLKQLKWFVSPQRAICCMVLDPSAEWLACGCRDASIALVPVFSLVTGRSAHLSQLPTDDITMIMPMDERAAPTCMIWWRTMGGRSVVISASAGGDLVFTDIILRRDVTKTNISCVVKSMQLIINSRLNTTHLLIGSSDGRWFRMLLESDSTELVVAHGFDIISGVTDTGEVVSMDPGQSINNILHRDEVQMPFLPKLMQLPLGVAVTVQHRGSQTFMAVHNSSNNTLQLFDADVELQGKALYTYNLLSATRKLCITDLMMFAVQLQSQSASSDSVSAASEMSESQRGLSGSWSSVQLSEAEPEPEPETPSAAVLNVLSMQFASPGVRLSPPVRSVSSGDLAVQRFSFPDGEHPLGVYACSPQPNSDESPLLSVSGGGLASTPSLSARPSFRLPGCVIVTTHGLYHCMQTNDPEAMFLDLLSSHNCDTTDADCLGVMMKLDVCKLYQIAADEKLQDGLVSEAMKYYHLSKCSHVSLVNRLASSQHMEAALAYLQKVMKADTSGPESKQLSDILFQVFLQQLLSCPDQGGQRTKLLSRLQRFVTDDFNYDPMEAMTQLADHGFAGLVLDIAHTRGLASDGFQLLLQRGHAEIPSSSCDTIISRGGARGLSSYRDGVFLRCLQPASVIQFVLADLDKLSSHLPLLRQLLPQLEHSSLLRLARVFDPSRSIIRPRLAKSKRKHARRGSNVSVASLSSLNSVLSDSSFTQQELRRTTGEAYVEFFLAVLLLLRQRRSVSSVSETAFIMSGIDEEISRHLARQRSDSIHGTRRKRHTQLPMTHSKRPSQLVACGELHAAAVSSGALHTWGKTRDGRLGHGDIIEEEGCTLPLRVEILHMHGIQVLAVDCGCEHTLALCQDGVYAWGSSKYGQLGLGDRDRRTRPSIITELSDKNIMTVVCGQYHSMALSRDQRVYSWGWGVHGQLGLSSCEDSMFPMRITAVGNLRIKAVSAGYCHSALLSRDGAVLTFGNNQYGQLGLGNNMKQSAPQLVKSLEKERVTHIACGNFFTVAITEGGDIYQWGRNLQATHRGQLRGYIRSRQNITELVNCNLNVPQMIQCGFEGKVKQISCGSCHGLLLTDSCHLYAWGANDYGELGQGARNFQITPKLISSLKDRRIISMATGDQFSVALDHYGEVWVWGRGDGGQLGMDKRHFAVNSSDLEEPTPLQGLSQSTGLVSPGSQQLGVPSSFGVNPSDTEDDLDIDFDLPELASFGGVPYGDQALRICLEHLQGYYSILRFLRLCMDWEQWQSAADMCDQLQLWPLALESRLEHLAVCKLSSNETLNEVQILFEKYLSYILGDAVDTALDTGQLTKLILALVSFWKRVSLPLSNLEAALRRHLSVLAEPLSNLIVHSKSPPSAYKGGGGDEKTAKARADSAVRLLGELSSSFHLQVVAQTVKQVTALGPANVAPASSLPRGGRSSADLAASGRNVEQSLWSDILQHLSKNLHQNHSITVPQSALDMATISPSSSLTPAPSSSSQSTATAAKEFSTSPPRRLSGIGGNAASKSTNDLVVFSCGHSFTRKNFDDSVVPEFRDLLSNLPVSLSNTAYQLQGHYLHSPCLAAACPLCVYDYLRQVQHDSLAVQ